MKKIEFIIDKNIDDNSVLLQFSNYLKKPSVENALNLIKNLLSYYINIYSLDSIKLTIEKIYAEGGHLKGNITINPKVLKNAKRIEGLPKLIEVLTHEIAHEILQLRNEKIEKTKIINEPYLFEFTDKTMFNLLKDIFEDIELANYAQTYYYSKSQNELYARKFAHVKTKEVLEKFAHNFQFDIKSFEVKEKELRSKFFSDPDLRMYIPLYDSTIIRYQKDILSKGLNNIDENLLNNLINSFKICAVEDVRRQFVNELIECNNFNILEKVFKSPILPVLNEEKSLLKRAYGDKRIQELLFKEREIEKSKN